MAGGCWAAVSIVSVPGSAVAVAEAAVGFVVVEAAVVGSRLSAGGVGEAVPIKISDPIRDEKKNQGRVGKGNEEKEKQ